MITRVVAGSHPGVVPLKGDGVGPPAPNLPPRAQCRNTRNFFDGGWGQTPLVALRLPVCWWPALTSLLAQLCGEWPGTVGDRSIFPRRLFLSQFLFGAEAIFAGALILYMVSNR